ncbi:MAG: carbohydrate ABC transporter permease [Chloroflexota bacterium]|nr:carbohydrate ABC transporter permease [Chloroflexota bacterium]MDE2858253.1 carbohydrate ABC transporter permease [Chloroflexota bacterium]
MPSETRLPIAAKAKKPPPRVNRSQLAIYAVLFAGVIIAVGPFLWMISASFMTLSEVNLTRLLPENLLWENYATALRRANFLDIELSTDPTTGVLQSIGISGYLWNSLRITLISVSGSLVVCIPAAYAFARMDFIGRNFIFALFLSTMMIPGIVMLIPHLLTVIWLGRLSESLFGPAGAWFNNWPALTIPFFASVFNIFLLRQFFIQIPNDLWEAARIDGAGHFKFLRSVVLPLSKAPIMTIVTLGFIGSWNALMWPLLVTINDDWRPIAVGLSNFVTADTPGDLNLQMAASVITVIPILILYFVAQKQFTEGIAQTGIRG